MFVSRFLLSRSPLGLRGLKYQQIMVLAAAGGRSPLGLRGLKYLTGADNGNAIARRSPLGLRGLKLTVRMDKMIKEARRSPLGLRGLKSAPENQYPTGALSQPSWAAWIEIASCSRILHK